MKTARTDHRAAGIDDSRDAIVRLGMEHLRQAGHATISIRTLAKQANLSSGAPYYHFPNRRALLVALALEGFARLSAIGEAIGARLAGTPRDAVRELALAFVKFSRDQPHLFDLMYESELTHPIDPELRPAFQRAFDLVVTVIAAAREAGGGTEDVIRAVSFWTALFGLARLLRHELLDPFATKLDRDWHDTIINEIVAAALRAHS